MPLLASHHARMPHCAAMPAGHLCVQWRLHTVQLLPAWHGSKPARLCSVHILRSRHVFKPCGRCPVRALPRQHLQPPGRAGRMRGGPLSAACKRQRHTDHSWLTSDGAAAQDCPPGTGAAVGSAVCQLVEQPCRPGRWSATGLAPCQVRAGSAAAACSCGLCAPPTTAPPALPPRFVPSTRSPAPRGPLRAPQAAPPACRAHQEWPARDRRPPASRARPAVLQGLQAPCCAPPAPQTPTPSLPGRRRARWGRPCVALCLTSSRCARLVDDLRFVVPYRRAPKTPHPGQGPRSASRQR